MKKINSIILAVLAIVFASCSDDNMYENTNHSVTQNTNVTETPKKTSNIELADDVEIYPLMYNKYRSADDVQILTPDTTTLSINTALLTDLKVSLKPGNVVSIWKSADEYPFMRRIKDVKFEGTVCKLQTSRVELDEIFKEAHIEFDTQIYTNPSVNSRCANGSVNDEFYQSASDGVIHPTAICFHSREEGEMLHGAQASSRCGSRAKMYGDDQRRTIVIDEMMPQSRATKDLGIDINPKLENMTYPIVSKGDTIASIGMQEAEFAFKGGIHARLDFSLWRGLERFELGPYYSMKGQAKLGLKMETDLAKFEYKEEIAQFPGFSAYFFVFGAPVVLQFTPSLELGTKFEAKAAGEVGADISFEGNHHTYAAYEKGRGWYLDNNGKPFTLKAEPYLGGSVSAELQSGIYFKGACKIYGCAGPTLTVGPYFKAEASVEEDKLDNSLTGTIKSAIGIGGEVGAEVKIWKWSLAEWKHPINIYELPLIDKKYDLKKFEEIKDEEES